MSYRKNNLTAIVTLIITIGLLIVSFAPTGTGYEFPKAVAIIMVVIAAILTLIVILSKKQNIAYNSEPMPWASIWPVLLVLSALLLIVEWLGFFAACFLGFYSIVLIYSTDPLSLRNVVRSGVISAIFIGVLYLVFVTLLNVQIPSGILI